jgi:hypothetical protein
MLRETLQDRIELAHTAHCLIERGSNHHVPGSVIMHLYNPPAPVYYTTVVDLFSLLQHDDNRERDKASIS